MRKIRLGLSGAHETGNDPNTIRARNGGCPRAWRKAMPKLTSTHDETKPSAHMNLLDRLARTITPLVATRPVYFIALLGLCAAYIQGGLTKLLDFNAAV